MKCNECGKPIPKARLEIMPNAKYCVKCADNHNSVPVGFMDFSHKTAGEIVIIKGDDEEALRLAKRANERGR